MIRVVITGPPSGTGFMPYRVDWWVRGEPPIIGVARYPLIDASRKLKQMGLMDSTVIGLFDERDREWKMRTTVGYGARQAIEDEIRAFRPPQPPEPRYDTGTGFDYFWRKSDTPLTPDQIRAAAEALDRIAGDDTMGQYREFPGGPLKDSPSDQTPTATPAERPRPTHIQPEHITYRDQAAATPTTSAKPHPKPRPKGSSGRRGGRSGR